MPLKIESETDAGDHTTITVQDEFENELLGKLVKRQADKFGSVVVRNLPNSEE
jgi:hypothetical protein